MARKKEEEEDGGKTGTHSASGCAILFELEYVAADGRQVICDVMKSVLADKGIDLSVASFARHCLERPLEVCLPALLAGGKKTRLSAAKLSAEISAGITLSFTGGSVRLGPALAALMKRAGVRGVALGALSSLDEESAGRLSERLGMKETGVKTVSRAADDTDPVGASDWLRLAGSLSCSPSRCVVLATGAEACRAALAAGMKCVAAPDRFTAFQDFGGADRVCETLDEKSAAEIVELAATL